MKKPIKKLDLRRETVTTLRVKSGMRTGPVDISAGPAANGAAKVGAASGGGNLV